MKRLCLSFPIVLLGLTLFVSGCGMLSLYSHRNIQEAVDWAGERLGESRYKNVKRTEIVDWTDSENHAAFVGIAISGGGNRAANFGIAVLRHLEDLGILKHASAISSVSGGSLAATYYGLFQDTDEWRNETTVRSRFATDLFRKWEWRLFYPPNLARYFFTGFDRSDLMAEVFDDVFFNGKTFSELPEKGPRIFINATNAASGQPFHFSNQFFKCIESSLGTYPLSYGVIASGAFPLIFQNVTLRDYSRSWGRRGPGRGMCDLGNTMGISAPQPYEIVFDDIADADALAAALLTDEDQMATHLRSLIGPQNIKWLKTQTDTAEMPTTLRKVLNVLINYRGADGAVSSIYDPQTFSGMTLSSEVKRLLEQSERDETHARRVNRLLLADVFPDKIRRVSRERFVHLFDGGSSENLGIETLREAATYYFANYFAETPSNVLRVDPSGNVFLGIGTVKSMSTNLIGYGAPLPIPKTIKKPSESAQLPKQEAMRAPGCLIISVDAHVNPMATETLYRPDPRGWIDFLFDRNAISATDTLLHLRRDDVLRLLNIKTDSITETAIHSVDLLTVTDHGESNRGKCSVWHISFNRLYSLYRAYQNPELARKAKLFHYRLAQAIEHIETHYKLRGPEGCSPEQIQEFLYEAAHALVLDDARTLDGIYSWFKEQGLELKPPPDSNNPLLKNIPIVSSRDGVSCQP